MASLSIPEASRDRDSSRALGETLLTASLPVTYSACFLTEPRFPCPRVITARRGLGPPMSVINRGKEVFSR